MFSVTGKFRANPAVTGAISWDGKPVGEPFLVGIAKTTAEALDGARILVGPVAGPASRATNYGDPLAFLWLLLDHVFTPGALVSGDIPKPPESPPGTIH